MLLRPPPLGFPVVDGQPPASHACVSAVQPSASRTLASKWGSWSNSATATSWPERAAHMSVVTPAASHVCGRLQWLA